MRGLLRILLALSLSFGLIHAVPGLDATTVRLLTLEEMIKAADTIFVGKCIAVESRRDEYGFPATYATFLVIEQIKGQLGEKVKIKQIGGEAPGVFKLPNLPTYTVGEEVLLFLHPTSRYGFTSPVGLHQGKWSVVESGPGKKMLRRSVTGSLVVKGSAGALYGQRDKWGRRLLDYSGFIFHLKKMVAQ